MLKIKGFNLYVREKYIFIFIIINLTPIILSIALILSKMVRPDLVPIHYDIFFGIDKIGPWYYILISPLYGLLIFFINGILGFYAFSRSKYVSYLLLLGSGIGNVFILLYLIALTSFAF